MQSALAEGLRFSIPELEVLQRACQLADREADLRHALTDGVLSTGSRGQVTVHPAAAELRLVEAQLLSLLQRVSLEETSGRLSTPAHRRAVKAARTRWDRADELAVRREVAARG